MNPGQTMAIILGPPGEELADERRNAEQLVLRNGEKAILGLILSLYVASPKISCL